MSHFTGARRISDGDGPELVPGPKLRGWCQDLCLLPNNWRNSLGLTPEEQELWDGNSFACSLSRHSNQTVLTERQCEGMVAKCSNPSCSTSFHYLKKGSLFRLETLPAARPSKFVRVEYFWLCEQCSGAMTLRLGEEGTVMAVPLPEPVSGVAADVALSSKDRGRVLLLRCISRLMPDFRAAAGTLSKGGHHAR